MFLHYFPFSSMLDSLTEGPLSTSSVVCSFLQLQSTTAPRKPATSSNCNFQRGDWILLTFPHTSPPSEMVNGESHGHKRSYAMMSGMNDGLCAEAEIIGTSSFPDFSFEVKITGLAVDVPCIVKTSMIIRVDDFYVSLFFVIRFGRLGTMSEHVML